MGDPDGEYEFFMDPPHPEAQPSHVDVIQFDMQPENITVVMLSKGITQWLEQQKFGYIPRTWYRGYMDRPDNFCCPCSAHAYERQRRNLRRHCAVLTGPVTRAWQMYAAVFNREWP